MKYPNIREYLGEALLESFLQECFKTPDISVLGEGLEQTFDQLLSKVDTLILRSKEEPSVVWNLTKEESEERKIKEIVLALDLFRTKRWLTREEFLKILPNLYEKRTDSTDR